MSGRRETIGVVWGDDVFVGGHKRPNATAGGRHLFQVVVSGVLRGGRVFLGAERSSESFGGMTFFL